MRARLWGGITAGLLAGLGPVAGAPAAGTVLVRAHLRPSDHPSGRELVVRGGDRVRFAALVRQAPAGARSRIGIEVPLGGGRVQAGALRGVGRRELGRSTSPFRPAGPPGLGLSLAASARGVAWQGPGLAVAVAREEDGARRVLVRVARGGVRLGAGSGGSLRAEWRGPRGLGLAVAAHGGAAAARGWWVGGVAALLVEGPLGAGAVGKAAGAGLVVGLRGVAAGGPWELRAALRPFERGPAPGAAGRAFSRVAASWIGPRSWGELRGRARVESEEKVGLAGRVPLRSGPGRGAPR